MGRSGLGHGTYAVISVSGLGDVAFPNTGGVLLPKQGPNAKGSQCPMPQWDQCHNGVCAPCYGLQCIIPSRDLGGGFLKPGGVPFRFPPFLANHVYNVYNIYSLHIMCCVVAALWSLSPVDFRKATHWLQIKGPSTCTISDVSFPAFSLATEKTEVEAALVRSCRLFRLVTPHLHYRGIRPLYKLYSYIVI